MVFDKVTVPVKKAIIGVTLAVLSAANLPKIGDVVAPMLDKNLVAPVTYGIIVAVVGAVGAYLVLAKEV